MKRRSFLVHAGALAGSAALGQLGVIAARAAAPGDYKALVCIFLYGGNDSNNMIVPIDSAGYANYAKLRSTIALPGLPPPMGCIRRCRVCSHCGTPAALRWSPTSARWCSR
jgi:uncharacterized protein (DUF1501 family)